MRKSKFVKDSGQTIKLSFETNIYTPISVDEGGNPYFQIKKIKTTDSYSPSKPLRTKWQAQYITSIPDPLGINGETLIGQRRADRPKLESRPPRNSNLDIETFKALFPIYSQSENEWALSTIVEGTDNSELLGWLFGQLERINNESIVSNLKNKILLNPYLPEEILSKNCLFCSKISTDRIIYSLPDQESAISINNDYPFGPILHQVLILQSKKHDISQITSNDIKYLYDLLYSVANDFNEKSKELDGIQYGMNYGLPRIHKGKQVIPAGASQPHLHSQATGIVSESYNLGDIIGQIACAYKNTFQRDYLHDYYSALKSVNMIIKEDENAFLYIPVSQKANYELQIMVKDSSVGNILKTTPAIRKSISNLELLAYQILQQDQYNIQSFNTLMYSSRFSSDNIEQRLIISICPRTTIIAFSELGRRNVVDQFPWDTANAMIGIKEKIMETGPQKLRILVISAHPDDLELGSGGFLLRLKEINKQHKIHALIVTDGCGGKGREPTIREKEANNAATKLGIDSLYFGRIRDGQAHGDTLYDLIKNQINRHKPDIILTHAMIPAEHLDHQNVSNAVTKISFESNKIPIIKFEIPVPGYSESSFHANAYLKMNLSLFEQKVEVLKSHQSEITRETVDVQFLKTKNKQRCSELFCQSDDYAEAFFVENGDFEVISKLLPFLEYT